MAVAKTAADLSQPETSIAQSSLFTGDIHEPQMYTELKMEQSVCKLEYQSLFTIKEIDYCKQLLEAK